MLLILGALAVGGWIAWDLFGPSDRDPNKVLPGIPEPGERLSVARPVAAAATTAPTGGASNRVIFWAGDSLTTAKPWRLAKLPGVKLTGEGWSGAQIATIIKHALPLIAKAHATDAVLRAGVNNVIADQTAERIEAELAAAWQALWTAGVRPWAGLLTPWAGHKKSTAARQAVTREVNMWIVAQVGKPGGPVAAIDARDLGDDTGKLWPDLSGDGLHMKQTGYVALAALDARALGGGTQANVGAVAVVPTGRRVLFLGDSLTASDYWRKVALPEGAVTGKGWPGNRIAQIMAKAADLIAATRPTDVVLLAGVNDLAGGRKAEAINADLDAAWTAIIAAGARPWAVLPTPWFGYTGGRAGEARPMFFADPATAAKLRAATEAVRAFIRGRAGQEGGPVAAIDTASLGDAQGRLLAKYSYDSLHMNGKGYAALASLVEAALRGGTNMQTTAGGMFTAAMFDGVLVGAELARAEFGYHDSEGEGVAVGYDATRAVVGDDGDINWPPGWRPAPQNVVDAVNEASAKFGVPRDIILSILWKESRFNPKLVGYKNATTDTSSKAYSPTFQASYARNKDLRIPGGGGMTWGQMFTPERWTATGVMMLLPYNIVSKPDGVKAGAPYAQLFDVRKNILCGTKLLADLYAKYGDWPTAILRFNGAKSYQREVLANVDALKQAQAAAA